MFNWFGKKDLNKEFISTEKAVETAKEETIREQDSLYIFFKEVEERAAKLVEDISKRETAIEDHMNTLEAKRAALNVESVKIKRFYEKIASFVEEE